MIALPLFQRRYWLSTQEQLFDLVDKGQLFNRQTALAIHPIAGKEEALKWGQISLGYVMITGSDYEPPAPDELKTKWQEVQ